MEGEKYIESHVFYPCTNESISAVVAGLDLKGEDIVVSVAGSGDIPFAIAPYVKKVYAVDCVSKQIDFMGERVGFLEKGNFDKFTGEGSVPRGVGDINQNHALMSKYYFREHFSEVKDSYSKIEIIGGGIVDFLRKVTSDSIDKIYLSNVLDWRFFHKGHGESVSAISDSLKMEGLVYNTLGDRFSDRREVSSFDFDEDRTSRARNFQDKERFGAYFWYPIVHRKLK